MTSHWPNRAPLENAHAAAGRAAAACRRTSPAIAAVDEPTRAEASPSHGLPLAPAAHGRPADAAAARRVRATEPARALTAHLARRAPVWTAAPCGSGPGPRTPLALPVAERACVCTAACARTAAPAGARTVRTMPAAAHPSCAYACAGASPWPLGDTTGDDWPCIGDWAKYCPCGAWPTPGAALCGWCIYGRNR
eukprot:4117063-Prymnesium_polylepis.1